MNLKIGILAPQSDMFPTLALDLVNGLKLALSQFEFDSNRLEIVLEGVGNAADKQLIEKAEKLVVQENVDLTIAFCGPHLVESFVNLFSAYRKPLIILDLGANLIRESFSSTHVLHHNLNLWQSTYASGKHAAEQLGKKAIIAASFYDGGYHLTESMLRGFEDHGGKITKFYVSPMDYKSESFDNLINMIDEEEPDLLFAIFSYKEGIKVFEKLAQSEYNGKLPIVAIPLMTDETINTDNYKLDKVYSVASWSFDDTSNEMPTFVELFNATYKSDPNVIGLLGYESGLIIGKAVTENGEVPHNIGEFFKGQTIESPRGKFTFNNLNETEVKSFKVRQFNYNQVKYHNSVLDTMENEFVEQLYKQFESLPDPNWRNPYICT